MQFLNNYQNQDKDFGILDLIALISFVLQLQNNEELKKQSTNDDIMQELRLQDNKFFTTIIEQNKTIIEQNKEIIKQLKKLRSNLSFYFILFSFI